MIAGPEFEMASAIAGRAADFLETVGEQCRFGLLLGNENDTLSLRHGETSVASDLRT